MAIYGALGEGFTRSYGTRPGEYLSRGLATMAGSTLVVTVPLPIRTVTHAVVCVKSTTSPPQEVSVGSYSNNTFTIYAWGPSGTGTAGATLTTPAIAAGVPASPASFVAPADGILLVPYSAALTTLSYTTPDSAGPFDLILATTGLEGSYAAQNGGTFIFTYTGTTGTSIAAKFAPFASASTSSGAAQSSTMTVEWAAWGTL